MPANNPNPASLGAEERRLRSRLHQLLRGAQGFLHGSLIEMARRCGNPRCRCAADDAHKHRSLYLSQTREGKTAMEYIPRDQEKTVRRWSEDFQRASSLLEEISQQGWHRLRQTKAKRKAAKGKAGASKAGASKAGASKAGASKAAKKKPAKHKTPAKTRQSKTTREPPSRPS
jgi:hypothetical protein